MNNENIMDCSSRIKLERQKRSWTQEQLAERAKLSPRTVQRIECGTDASPETLRLIAEAFGLSAEALRASPMRTHFRAPWSRNVKVITTVVCGLMVGLIALQPLVAASRWSGVPPLLAIFSLLPCLFFAVNGYSIKEGRLLIHRLGWATKFDLSQLAGFEINPHVTMGSIRLFGNGGVFCYIGLYRNAILGNYRAYVTDTAKSVVLDFGDRKIVVSPDDPEAFVESLRESVKGVCSEPAKSAKA